MTEEEVKVEKLKAIRVALINMQAIIDRAERQLAEATVVLDRLVRDL